MIKKIDKNVVREKRHIRVKKNVSGTKARPRMSIYRSSAHIYAQLIDDTEGKTLAASSTIAKGVNVKGKTKSESAAIVGADLAKKALAKGISAVVFDRGGYLYTGRVKSLADGAREAGLKF